jgi:hypothetical protein
MAFDGFFFWEGVRAGFRTWAPKMIKNLIVATGAFLVSVVLIYITWDKAVVNFGFLTPKIGLEQAFWLAIPIRVVIALYKAITGILSSIKEGNDKEFESNKKPENKTQEPEVRGKLPNYRRHPSHQPPQKREQPIQYPQHQ